MTSPMMTVILLAVLWLIVVVPMVLRRKDERAGERTIARFGAAMGALGNLRDGRAPIPDVNVREAGGSSEPMRSPHSGVVGAGREAAGASSSGGLSSSAGASSAGTAGAATATAGPVSRRPVPVAKESLLYPPDPRDLSDARRRMLVRRRRSLITLGAALVLFLVAAVVTGSTLARVPFVLTVLSLGGYLFFLRSQALRDRDRRENRRQRTSARPAPAYDATVAAASAPVPHNVVRIDEDDVDLDHLDTVDLTGLYSEREVEPHEVRRAG